MPTFKVKVSMPSTGFETIARIVAGDPAHAEQKAKRSLLNRMQFDVSEVGAKPDTETSSLDNPVTSTGSLSFWVSWYQEEEPVNLNIISPWWRSTETTMDGWPMIVMCAAVRADDVGAAMAFIERQIGERFGRFSWRFADEMHDKWSPFNKRFPREDWMAWD